MGWFTADETQFDPQTFNYNTEAERLKRRQALAEQLMSQQAPGGQMVSGWYVPPSKVGTVGSVLQNAVGGYLSKKNRGEQKTLDDNSRKALAYLLSQQPTDQAAGQSQPRAAGQDAAQPATAPAAQQLDYFARLAQTGPQGQAVAQGMTARMFAPPTNHYESKVADDGTVTTTNQQTGEVKVTQGTQNAGLATAYAEELTKRGYQLTGKETVPQLKLMLDNDNKNREFTAQQDDKRLSRETQAENQRLNRELREQTNQDRKDYQQQQAEAKKTAADEKAVNTTLGQFNNADSALNVIEKLQNHPGKSAAVGASVSKAVTLIPGIPDKGIPGTDMRDFNDLNDQLKGTTFLAAVQQMKGSGALSDIEGQKAQAAIAQLSTSQSEKQYNEALATLKSLLFKARERAAQGIKAHGGEVPAYTVADPVQAVAGRPPLSAFGAK